MPRREPVEVRILRPRAAGAALGYEEAAELVCDHIRPRRGRKSAPIQIDAVVAVRVDRTDPVVEAQRTVVGHGGKQCHMRSARAREQWSNQRQQRGNNRRKRTGTFG